MAVALIMDFKGASLDQYDQILADMDLGGKVPPNAISHWAAATDDGFRVVDVWESREAFDKFAEEKIGPLSAKAGIEGPPEITEFQVHNTLAQ